MSWRIVVISQHAKLDLKMNSLAIRQEESSNKIHLSEISMLIIENTAVSMTSCLLCELVKRKIKVIFCDEKRNPISEITPYQGSHDTTLKVRTQVAWEKKIKELVWTEIVTEKIRMQKDLLVKLNKPEADLIDSYINEIELNDITNREGHAAKVYFNALFGNEFTRSMDNNLNAALNYGYTILLSAFNREIVASGYITQIGLFHDNMFNPFNFGSDLMEPFRVLVDREVMNMDLDTFERNEKMQLVNLLNMTVLIDGKVNFVNNAIKIYCKSVFDALNEEDVSVIRFYRNEL